MRVAVVGLGHVTQLHHLPNLVATSRVTIVALCDLSRQLATRLAEAYGLPDRVVTANVAEALDREPDAMVVTNRDHAPLVLAALGAGLHVFVEKPLCWSEADAVAIADAARRADRSVVVGYMKRYDPAVERVLDNGPDGAYLVRAHSFAGGRHRRERLHHLLKPTGLGSEPGAAESAAVDAAIASGLHAPVPERVQAFRTLAELASHDINLLRALLGELTVEWARAFATPVGRGQLVVLRANGVPVTLEVLADFESPRDWDEALVVYEPAGSTEIRFGSPFVPGSPTLLRQRRAEGTDVVERSVLVSKQSPYRRELDHFLDCAAGAAEPRTGVEDAARDLALLRMIADRLDLGC